MSSWSTKLSLKFSKVKIQEESTTAKHARQATAAVLNAMDLAPLSGPVIKAAAKLLDAIGEFDDNNDDLNDLVERVRDLVETIKDATKDAPNELGSRLQGDLDRIARIFEEIYTFVRKINTNKYARRLLQSKGDATQIKKYNDKLDHAMQVFSMASMIDIRRNLGLDGSKAPTRPELVLSRISSRLPARPLHFHGRQHEINSILDVLEKQRPARICVLGSGGIGKSALTVEIMHNPRIQQVFGQARMFVRLDSAQDSDAVLSSIALLLGLTGADLMQQVIAVLSSLTPALLALDNFETPWDSPHRVDVERLLGRFAELPNISLIITLRGKERPWGVDWTKPRLPPLEPVSLEAAQEILDSVADCRGPEWDILLKEVDCVPLAVQLLAHLADGEESPNLLLVRWRQEKEDMLKRSGPSEDRESSIAFSIQLSLNSPRVASEPDAKKLLSLLSLLPDGIAREDLVQVFEGTKLNVAKALATLHNTSLAYTVEEGLRHVNRVLAPIRLFVRRRYHSEQPLLDPLISYYMLMATNSSEVWEKADSVLPQLSNQLGNIDAMLTLTLELQPEPSESLLKAVLGFASFTEFSNLGSFQAVQTILQRKPSPDTEFLYARCHRILAALYFRRSELAQAEEQFVLALKLCESAQDLSCAGMSFEGLAVIHKQRQENEVAEDQFMKALRLFKECGNLVGQGNTLKGLADIHVQKSELGAARGRYLEALEVFRSTGSRQGQGNCILGLAEIHGQMSELDEAQERYLEALKLFEDCRWLTGQGTCLEGLGKIKRRKSEFDAAISRYRQSLELYKAAGDQIGKGNSLNGLADVHMDQADFAAAQEEYEAALKLFEKAEARIGQGNSLLGLAQIHMRRAELDAAGLQYSEALKLFEGASDPIGQANCWKGLGTISLQKSELDTALEQCMRAMTLYEQAGLVVDNANCVELMGNIHLMKSELDSAQVRYLEASKLFEAAGSLSGRGSCLKSLGTIHLWKGEFDAAERRFGEALELFNSSSDLDGQANCVEGIADVHLRKSDLASAETSYTEALRIFRTIEAPVGQGVCLAGLAEVKRRMGDIKTARTHLEEASRIFGAAGHQHNVTLVAKKLEQLNTVPTAE